eukprot:1158471-Pelagomonas_calceolata.AAC.2
MASQNCSVCVNTIWLYQVDLEPWRCSSAAKVAALGPQAVLPERSLAGSSSLRGASQPSQASVPAPTAISSEDEDLVVDGQIRQDGVFIWDISVKEGDEGQPEAQEHERLVRASNDFKPNRATIFTSVQIKYLETNSGSKQSSVASV